MISPNSSTYFTSLRQNRRSKRFPNQKLLEEGNGPIGRFWCARRSSDIGRADSRPRRTFPATGITRPRTRALAPRAHITREMHAPHTPRAQAQAPALAQHGAYKHCAVQHEGGLRFARPRNFANETRNFAKFRRNCGAIARYKIRNRAARSDLRQNTPGTPLPKISPEIRPESCTVT